ncbi:hypothetical protein E8E15_006387 [Penicillium rubens]|uniref:Pc12g13320 protein n=1 Tax=Penicillium rubens (strain ATCC 28089 / DSM 1075 / NRRL 1951 / Wisconsin 54-1255) TaxID=500485 RepID=B6GZT1_PENRW|nr:uncharacterized protein N7525_001269 [Penicillium rubens]KAF3017336.1 hypothetical protein E8E15_006387 [Penicillium rubens]KAJ5843528.1 hypothetical protein N7525_001269 [Penicillium rubens]KAJ5845887.1 hypothetical protein N7534_009556 [Penicillium rubens]CAP80959.1 Pc12g13320 [Penicillium rubens Wisconsin 54-1255]
MILQVLLTFATLGLAVDYPVVSLFIPNADPQPLLGEVLAAQSATTTYSINCPPGNTNSTQCGMGPGLFLTSAPTSVEYLISAEADNVYNHVVCVVTDLPTGAYTCTDTVTGKGPDTPGTSTSTIGWDQITLFPVTITSTADAVLATANAGSTAKNASQVLPGSQASPAAAATSAAAAATTIDASPTAPATTGSASPTAADTAMATTPAAGAAARLSPTSLVLACAAAQALVVLLL